jgi:hypothetical protein
MCKDCLHHAGMTTPEIIEALGGRQAVAEITGSHPAAVSMWRRNGVPAKHWHVLVDHAVRAGIAGITFASLQATKPEPAAA